MQCNGKEIRWCHLKDLYERDRKGAAGLCLLPKIKYEHIHLTSFSKYFDALNVSNYTDGLHKLKAFKHPYRSAEDFRLKVNLFYGISKHTLIFIFYCSGLRRISWVISMNGRHQ